MEFVAIFLLEEDCNNCKEILHTNVFEIGIGQYDLETIRKTLVHNIQMTFLRSEFHERMAKNARSCPQKTAPLMASRKA